MISYKIERSDYKPQPKPKTFREAGLEYGKNVRKSKGKPMPNIIPKGIDSRITTKQLKQAGYLTESALGLSLIHI